MRRNSLQVVVDLRRLEERRRRVELAERMNAAQRARALLGAPPRHWAQVGGHTGAAFLAQRAELHAAWAVYGARLERSERAALAEAAARSAWANAAADLRATERLVERRRRRRHEEAARRAQRDLDEVAVAAWQRGRRGE